MLEFKFYSADEARKQVDEYNQKCLEEDREQFYRDLFGTIKFSAMRGCREATFGNFYGAIEKVQLNKEEVFQELLKLGFKPIINKIGNLVIRFH